MVGARLSKKVSGSGRLVEFFSNNESLKNKVLRTWATESLLGRLL